MSLRLDLMFSKITTSQPEPTRRGAESLPKYGRRPGLPCPGLGGEARAGRAVPRPGLPGRCVGTPSRFLALWRRWVPQQSGSQRTATGLDSWSPFQPGLMKLPGVLCGTSPQNPTVWRQSQLPPHSIVGARFASERAYPNENIPLPLPIPSSKTDRQHIIHMHIPWSS
jgi:hypothetical protein